MTPNRNIVFIHGNSSSPKVFEPIIRIWNRTEKLISIELPGHGDAARSDDYSWSTTKKYVLDKISKIDGEILLIGNSVGGHIVMEIAPDIKLLKGLMLLGSPPLKIPLNLQEAFAPNPYTPNYLIESPEQKDLEETFNAIVQNKSVIPILREDFSKTDPKVRSTFLNDVSNSSGFLNEADIIGALNCKKYFVNGAQDPAINFEYLDQIQKKAGHPIESFVIENCGHYPTLDTPEKFVSILENILDEVFS